MKILQFTFRSWHCSSDHDLYSLFDACYGDVLRIFLHVCFFWTTISLESCQIQHKQMVRYFSLNCPFFCFRHMTNKIIDYDCHLHISKISFFFKMPEKFLTSVSYFIFKYECTSQVKVGQSHGSALSSYEVTCKFNTGTWAQDPFRPNPRSTKYILHYICCFYLTRKSNQLVLTFCFVGLA